MTHSIKLQLIEYNVHGLKRHSEISWIHCPDFPPFKACDRTFIIARNCCWWGRDSISAFFVSSGRSMSNVTVCKWNIYESLISMSCVQRHQKTDIPFTQSIIYTVQF
jgi:hypothetical protein